MAKKVEKTTAISMGGRLILDLSRGAYTSVATALKEYVSNSWDAAARQIDISVFEPGDPAKTQIEILDDGGGMNAKDLQEKFFRVGRDRRKEEGDFVRLPDGGSRRVHGRKGLGKLAGLRLANELIVITHKGRSQSGAKMDLKEIEKDPNRDPLVHWFDPRGDAVPEPRGTLIRLADYSRRKPIDMEDLAYQLRLWFEFGQEANVTLRELEGGAEKSTWNIARSELFKELETHERDETVRWQDGNAGRSRKISFRWAWLPKSKTNVRSMISVLSGTRALSTEETFAMEAGWTNMFGVYKLLGELTADWIDKLDQFDPADIKREGVNWDIHPALEAVRDAGRAWVISECRARAKKEPEAKETQRRVAEIVEERPRLKALPAPVRQRLVSAIAAYATATAYPERDLDKLVDLFEFVLEHGALIQFLSQLKEGGTHTLDEFLSVAQNFSAVEITGLLRVTENKLALVRELYELVKDPETLETARAGRRDITSFIVTNPWIFDPELRIDHKNVGMKKILLTYDGESVENLNRLPFDFWDIRPDLTTYQGPSGKPWCIELKAPTHKMNLEEADTVGHYLAALRAGGFANTEVFTVSGTYAPEARTVLEQTVGARVLDYAGLLERAKNQIEEFIEKLKEGLEGLPSLSDIETPS